jgi:hypothetical protein
MEGGQGKGMKKEKKHVARVVDLTGVARQGRQRGGLYIIYSYTKVII